MYRFDGTSQCYVPGPVCISPATLLLPSTMGLHLLATGHEDLIHDTAFDYYGRTFATCSSDRHIRVFVQDSNEKWILRDSWKAHDSAVVKLAWAPPEYGQILASVSYDRTLKIWEHKNDAPTNSGNCYQRLCTLNDCQGPLFDLAFAPGYLEVFRLASIGSDGVLRIYEAFNISDLTDWQLIQLISIIPKPANMNLQANFTVNWCKSKFAREKICVSALDVALILLRDSNNKYKRAKAISDHNSLIRDVAWAPSMGRSYELLATASKDGYVRIFKITDVSVDGYELSTEMAIDEASETNDFSGASINDELRSKLEIKQIAEHDDHKSDVWSVDWNSTGTLLSSTGSDGKVRFWKAGRQNEFICIATTSAQKQ